MTSSDRTLHHATVCVHTGTVEDKNFGGVNSPIYNSSAFEFLDRPQSRYPRYHNTPNQLAVAEKLCALEYAEAGLVMSSGMAAISSVFAGLLQRGDHVVIQQSIYGGTHHFVRTQFEALDITYTLVAGTATEDYAAAINQNTKMIYFETPGNPLLDILDVRGLARLAQDHELYSVVDNTFASPVNCNPIALGVDVVVHSGTKYLGGHSDLIFGAVLTSQKLYQKLHTVAVNWGGNLDAYTCYMIERSLKTLYIRVKQQNENAMLIAQDMQANPAIHAVYYPGLPTHPGHELATQQMQGYGGMLSFEIDQSKYSAAEYCHKLQLIKTAVSLGGVETTVTIPALTSHSKMTAEDRKQVGISDNLIRLSVGIEQAQDLIYDLLQPLN